VNDLSRHIATLLLPEPAIWLGSSVGAVRHATDAALDRLEPLLSHLRELSGLVEKKRGVFYRRSDAFLHFHEDPSGLHADIRLEREFERFRVETSMEQRELLKRVKRVVGGNRM
jgi:hypothetical protein